MTEYSKNTPQRRAGGIGKLHGPDYSIGRPGAGTRTRAGPGFFIGRPGRFAGGFFGPQRPSCADHGRLPQLAPEQRPAVGQAANTVKERCNALFEARKSALEAGREAQALARFDPSLPGRAPWRGSLHPTTLITEDICRIFQGLGFEVASGPEVENDYYNFEALNMPPEHPARDMQDTLYITDKVVMAHPHLAGAGAHHAFAQAAPGCCGSRQGLQAGFRSDAYPHVSSD